MQKKEIECVCNITVFLYLPQVEKPAVHCRLGQKSPQLSALCCDHWTQTLHQSSYHFLPVKRPQWRCINHFTYRYYFLHHTDTVYQYYLYINIYIGNAHPYMHIFQAHHLFMVYTPFWCFLLADPPGTPAAQLGFRCSRSGTGSLSYCSAASRPKCKTRDAAFSLLCFLCK